MNFVKMVEQKRIIDNEQPQVIFQRCISMHFRSSHSEVFFKKAVRGKHLLRSPLYSKAAGLYLKLFYNKTTLKMFFFEFSEFFQSSYSIKDLQKTLFRIWNEERRLPGVLCKFPRSTPIQKIRN